MGKPNQQSNSENESKNNARGTEFDERPERLPGASEFKPEGMSGMGPVGYRRSDEDILHDVYEKLNSNGQIDASLIEATIQDGIVTLMGTVKSEKQLKIAEDTVLHVPGVWKVNNQLQIP